MELDQPTDLDGLRGAVAVGAAPLGGGDLHLRRRTNLPSPGRLVAVQDVAEISRIECQADGGWKIGAGITLADLSGAVAGNHPGLVSGRGADRLPQIRQIATLGAT